MTNLGDLLRKAADRMGRKRMRVPRGTARRLRRERAKSIATAHNVDPSDFRMFWRMGGDASAATRLEQEKRKEERRKANEARKLQELVEVE